MVDASNVEPEARPPFLALARGVGRPSVAIVLDLPETLGLERNGGRSEWRVAPDGLRRHVARLPESLPRLSGEGFSRVFVLSSPKTVERARIERRPRAPRRADPPATT